MKRTLTFDHVFRRRLAKLARRWERLLKSGGFSRLRPEVREKLCLKTRRYVQMPAFARVRPYLAAGTAALLMQTAASFDAQAQFAPAQTNVFGLPHTTDASDEVVSHAFVDIDNDGDLDCFASNEYGVVTFYENTGTANTPAFQQQPNTFGLQTGYYQFGMAFADLDGDGDYDMMSAGYSYDYDIAEFHYWENTGTPEAAQFGADQINPFGITIPSASMYDYVFFSVFADIDNDGDMDLFASSYDYYDYSVGLLYYENTGSAASPQFGPQKINPFGFPGLGSEEYLAVPFDFVDIDGDGDLDLYTSPYNATSLLFAENTGTPTAPAFAATVPTDISFGAGEAHQPVFADIDGDGDEDLFVFEVYVEYSNNAFYYFENTNLPDGIGSPPGGAGSPMLQAWPNPASDLLFISLPETGLADGGEVGVQLYGPAGRVLRQARLPVLGGRLQLDTSGLPPGVYLVAVDAEDSLRLARFVKE